jgi:hypothetical protein
MVSPLNEWSDPMTLKELMKAEARAWRKMMRGSEEDARTVFGEEGKNYLAWCAMADAEYAFRQEHGL